MSIYRALRTVSVDCARLTDLDVAAVRVTRGLVLIGT